MKDTRIITKWDVSCVKVCLLVKKKKEFFSSSKVPFFCDDGKDDGHDDDDDHNHNDEGTYNMNIICMHTYLSSKLESSIYIFWFLFLFFPSHPFPSSHSLYLSRFSAPLPFFLPFLKSSQDIKKEEIKQFFCWW